MEEISKEIERYHDGEMSPDEVAEFEARIAEDSALREEVERDASMRNVAEALGWLQMRNQVAQVTERMRMRRRRGRVFAVTGIAAGVALLCVAGWALLGGRKATLEATVKEYTAKWTLETSSLLGAEDEQLKKARIDYQAARYQDAIDNAQEVVCRDGGDTVNVNILIGYAYLHLEEYGRARNVLNQAKRIASEWDDEAHWGLALAKLADRDYDAAIVDLDWLLEDHLKTPPKLKTLADELKRKIQVLKQP